MNDNEFVDEAEQAAANDPSVGTGTPHTAPHEIPFEDDDELDPAGESGDADDDEDIDDDDESMLGSIDEEL